MSIEPFKKSKNESENLSTDGLTDPLKILAQLDSSNPIVIVVAVWPRRNTSGLLEERGRWILKVWSHILHRVPGVKGCRLLWNSLFFAVELSDLAAIRKCFEDTLKSFMDENLDSFCVLSQIVNVDIESSADLIDRMQEKAIPSVSRNKSSGYYISVI